MGYSKENGYTPSTVEEIMALIVVGVNEQFGTTYTAETFLGTGFYKHFYVLAQRIQANEIKMSEIFLKLQDYFKTTNETIVEPKVTHEGLIAVFLAAGYVASIDKPIEANAGKIFVCVDVDENGQDYAAEKLEINTILKDYTAAGTITEGTETSTIVLTNGQAFDFSFNLPTRVETFLKLTLTTSRNNRFIIDDTDTIKLKLLENIQARYALGKDFEPEIYFTREDAPYAGDILLEWSDDESDWHDETFEAAYNDLFEITLANISIVQV